MAPIRAVQQLITTIEVLEVLPSLSICKFYQEQLEEQSTPCDNQDILLFYVGRDGRMAFRVSAGFCDRKQEASSRVHALSLTQPAKNIHT